MLSRLLKETLFVAIDLIPFIVVSFLLHEECRLKFDLNFYCGSNAETIFKQFDLKIVFSFIWIYRLSQELNCKNYTWFGKWGRNRKSTIAQTFRLLHAIVLTLSKRGAFAMLWRRIETEMKAVEFYNWICCDRNRTICADTKFFRCCTWSWEARRRADTSLNAANRSMKMVLGLK